MARGRGRGGRGKAGGQGDNEMYIWAGIVIVGAIVGYFAGKHFANDVFEYSITKDPSSFNRLIGAPVITAASTIKDHTGGTYGAFPTFSDVNTITRCDKCKAGQTGGVYLQFDFKLQVTKVKTVNA